MALSGENHALTDFSARARGVGRGRLSRGICLRDMFARKTQKGTGWERALESPSNPFAYTASNDSRKREYSNSRGKERDGERERDVLASSSGFKLADTPGASRRPLWSQLHFASPKAPHLHPRPMFPGLSSLLEPRSVPWHVPVTLDTGIKAKYLVRYSARNSHVILVCVIWVIVFFNCRNPRFELCFC